jgi:hypothetical protein
MSKVGKETMLKSVAQAIPTYIMSCFQIPENICNRMRATISNHWWGFEGGKKTMALEIMALANDSKIYWRDGL